MKGKTALVTGSSEGLGRAILLRLAAEGANVVINYHRNETAAKEVKTAAEAEGVRAIVVQADVSSVPDIERLYDAAVEEFGRIDIVVANAGMEKVNIPFTDVTEEDFDLLWRVNTKGPYMVAPQDAVARAPEGLPFEEIAPMMCGGITAFNGLRHSKAGPGDLVAVHGVGGVGHLAVQFGDKMGFRVVAIARGPAREELARRLGASEYIDSTAGDASEALRAMGGAAVIFDTVSHGNLQSGLISGLRPNGQLIVAEGLDPITVTGHDLAFPRLNISGWYSGVAADSEDTLNFAVLKGVHPIVETHPLADAETTFLNRNKANIRPVLIP